MPSFSTANMSYPVTMLSMFVCILLMTEGAHSKPPNIVFIVADDLGWNDVGFHNPDVITPNIDKLATQGVIFNQSYVQPVCTPSRNSFMTGHYAFKSGLQHLVIFPGQTTCSPMNYTFLPQKLKELGYATHAVGKWHLGFCKWECTPTYRGFDTFYGYYNGAEDYYTHIIVNGIDFRDSKTPVNVTGEYSAHMYATRAESIIMNHDVSRPLYIYLPFQSVHQPLQVPERYSNMYPNTKNESRKTYLGMVSALDEAIGNVTKALKEKGIYDDTLIIFTADNGGWIPYSGNNYPLRGGKTTVYEGGTRAAAFIAGAGLQKKGYTYNGMMHAVDWMPTVLSAAGGSPDKSLDGIDQWESISSGGESKRTEFIYNIDDMKPEVAAIRVGDYKLIEGYAGAYPGWYKPDDIDQWQNDKSINMTSQASGLVLFNLKDDPTEHFDLSQKMPDMVKKLQSRLEFYHKQIVPANFPSFDQKSLPQNFNGFWSPGWC